MHVCSQHICSADARWIHCRLTLRRGIAKQQMPAARHLQRCMSTWPSTRCRFDQWPLSRSPMFLGCPVHDLDMLVQSSALPASGRIARSRNIPHVVGARCMFTKVSTFTAVSQGRPVAGQPHRCRSLLTITHAPAVCDSPALSVRACRSTVRSPLGGCAALSRGTLRAILVPCVTCSLHATGSIHL